MAIYGGLMVIYVRREPFYGALKSFLNPHKPFYIILKAFEIPPKPFNTTLLSVYLHRKTMYIDHKSTGWTLKASDFIHKPFDRTHKPSA